MAVFATANEIQKETPYSFFNPSDAVQAFDTIASGDASNYVRGKLSGVATSYLDDFFENNGQTRLHLNLDDNWSLHNSSIDTLIPLYENEDTLFFSQLGFRNKEKRNTLNAGLGVRKFSDDFVYGFNAFYDDDITGHNRRFGAGVEFWGSNAKLNINKYWGTVSVKVVGTPG